MTLAPYVRIVAQGKGRARSLSFEEARQAMGIILTGDAAPEAIGALLMVLRLRGETDAEIAGFTAALRDCVPCDHETADLDWPCYAAGRTRTTPLFLLSAKIVAEAGYKVHMHGWNSHQSQSADVRQSIAQLDLESENFRYSPLETLSPRAFQLLNLRDTFGLRSCINTVLRMWNPSRANASVQGVFHPSYRGLQSRAAALLGDQNLTIIKGGGGEFERNPAKDASVFGLRAGCEIQHVIPAIIKEHRRLHDTSQVVDIMGLWSGSVMDQFAVETVKSTAALALWTVGAAPDFASSAHLAALLWDERHIQKRKSA